MQFLVRCLWAVGAVLLLSCNGAEGQGSGSGDALSGPPVFNEHFHMRNPRKCTDVTKPPNASQAAALVQCHDESATAAQIFLRTNVKVEMGAARAFNSSVDSGWNDIDPSAKVYPIRGHLTNYICDSNPNIGCSVFTGDNWTTGACWKTSFGNWTCTLAPSIEHQANQQPGPTTY
jgi:hypothetical protein